MFWRNLKLKILKDKRHVGINIFPTSKCDTGCSHCMDDCNSNNPVHFSKELAKKIVNEALLEMWGLSVFFTGYGEPLLCPEFLEIVDIFGSYERIDDIKLITSGFTDKEHERKERIGKLLARPYSRKILIDQSFSLYHDSFPERLANMARLIIEKQGKGVFRVRACMSIENAEKTQKKIEEVVKDLAKELKGKYFPVVLGFHKNDRKHFGHFEKTATDDDTAFKLYLETFLTPQWHGIRTESGGIVLHVIPVSLEQAGRASKIKETPFEGAVCGMNLYEEDETHLFIGPDGEVYPECSCHPSEYMQLGRIGVDRLVDLVRQRDSFSKRICQAILVDERMCKWGTSEVCVLCKQIVAEKGIGLR